ncbi:hypothetical protein [Myxococcus sp. AS-1-15]|uniref:hypothetical protein n=1 Tax=Myxococcus sp. AS-1-15 TaxID=2874600 RepID=UPI001CBB055D|nr:hypothetical protein [Myxococcus sp. AS-1-15]MBZ4400393.1 hypothetical protein [Myxococcus sp. AS-1-15]
MSDFPGCPRCQQKALYPKPETSGLTCAACGHVTAARADLVAMARDALLKKFRGSVERFEQHWASKLREEREKVKRLAEGRW